MLKAMIAIEIVALVVAAAYLLHRRQAAASAAGPVEVQAPLPQALPVVSPQQAPVAQSSLVLPSAGGSDLVEKGEELFDRPLPSLARPSILIEKSAGRVTIFDDGRPVKRYLAAVGGGRGDKTREGDLCTPLGEFFVCVKNPKSQYVLSLGLSYPNVADAERGLLAGQIDRSEHRSIVEAIRDRRQPPWNTALGGEIMIHGSRNGRDATQGCIALDDNHIRELYPAIAVGTPVTILP